MRSRLLAAIVLIALIATPARASQSDIGRIHAGMTWRPIVAFGDTQHYYLSLQSDEVIHDAYVLWLLDRNIGLVTVDSSMDCTVTHDTILCYMREFSGTVSIDIRGLTTGPGTNGYYVNVAVGDNRYEHQRLAPATEYLGMNGTIPGGTIPMLTPTPVTALLFPDIRSE